MEPRLGEGREQGIRSLLRGYSWVTAVSVVDRAAALVQTVLAARAIGIAEYGKYGLMLSTVGTVASVVALQMGFAATIYVARYRDHEKDKAAQVVAYANLTGYAGSVLVVLLTIPFASGIRGWLFGDGASDWTVMLGALLVASAILSGVQEGIVQGFEDFRFLAMNRLATTLGVLALIYPVGRMFGLSGILALTFVVSWSRLYFLMRAARRHLAVHSIPPRGDGVRWREMLWGFSLPSMLVNLCSGAVRWAGNYAVSRQVGGFASLALVSAGLQWQGPVMLLTTSMAAVAIPAFSRHHQQGNQWMMQRVWRDTLLLTAGLATVAVVAISLLAPVILTVYGREFKGGTWTFVLLVCATLPQAVGNVFQQELAATDRMWDQAVLIVGLTLLNAAAFLLLVPRYGGTGYGWALLASWSLFVPVLAVHRARRQRKQGV